MKKNRILKNIKVEKIGYGGVGIGLLENGKKVMIRGGILPRSIVDCRVTKERKDFIEAEVIEVISFDENWANETPLCSHFNNPLHKTTVDTIHKIGCGGCKWQMTSYENQISIKESLILDSFRSNQKILEHAPLLPILPSPQKYQYRNKIEFSFGKYITGKRSSGDEVEDEDSIGFIHHDWQLGFHKQGQFSKILDVDQCFLISQKLHSVYKYCKDLLKSSGLATYDQKTHIGFFRHLALREGVHTNHIMVNLVVADNNLLSPQQKLERDTLRDTLKKDSFLNDHVKTFIVTGNNGLADIVKGHDIHSEILFGDGTIYENLVFSHKIVNQKDVDEDDVVVDHDQEPLTASFRISPFSFFQTNTYGTELLFGTAAALVGDVKGTILDLYCGAGTIGISFLKMGKGDNVVGIEIVDEAIRDAKINADINGCQKDTYFVAGKAEDLVYKDPMVQEKIGSLGLIIIDPPRCGLHKNVISFINGLKKSYTGKLLYISCNPVTLARDLEMFEQGGWKTKLLQPVDMFPHTHHIEMIAILQ